MKLLQSYVKRQLSPNSMQVVVFIRYHWIERVVICLHSTQIGRNWFQRVAFRITSTSEIFQRLMSEILADIDWDDAIIDDVIVWWQSTEELNMTSVQTVGWTEFRKLGWNSTEPNASSESRALSILATWLVKIGSVLVQNVLEQSAIWFLRQI